MILPILTNLINVTIASYLSFNYFHVLPKGAFRNISGLLLIANLFPLAVGALRVILYGYGSVPMIIQATYLLDRVVMLTAYISFIKFITKVIK